MKKYLLNNTSLFITLAFLSIIYIFSPAPINALDTDPFGNPIVRSYCQGVQEPSYSEVYTIPLGEYRSCASGSCGTMWCQTQQQRWIVTGYTCTPTGWSGYWSSVIEPVSGSCNTSTCSATNWPNCSGGGTGGGGGGYCGDGICNNAETNASCPNDCPVSSSSFNVSVSPGTRSVVNGEQTTYVFTIGPVNTTGSAGTYTLSVSGCPTGATCVYDGGTTATVGTDTSYSTGDQYDVPVQKTLRITPTLVTPSTYTLTFSATRTSGGSGTKSTTANLIVNSGVNNASCTSITAPSTLTTGQSFTATVVMQNNGTKAWRRFPSSGNHRLGSRNPTDNNTWGTGRIELPNDVSPGQSVTILLPLTAPSTAGSYNLTWGMLEEGVQWFGTLCDRGFIPVSAPTPISGTLSPSAPTCSIASGASSCTVNLTWSTTNPVGTSAITATGMTSVNGNSGTNVSFTVPYSSRTFYLYNNAILLGTSNATASCISGTTWNGSICAPPAPPAPTVSMTAPVSATVGAPFTVSWTSTGASSVITTSSVMPATGCTMSPSTALITNDSRTVTCSTAGPKYFQVAVWNSIGVQAIAGRSVDIANNQYSLTVEKTIGGSVTSADSLINCGTTCIRSYSQGTNVVLTAIPDTGQWRFVGWSGGGCTGTSTCTVTVNSNQTVRALFRPRSLQYQEF